MTRPPILLIEPEPQRRQELSRSLAAEGYEVVPSAGAGEGLRFALGLEEAVILAPARLLAAEHEELLGKLTTPAPGQWRTVVVLGEEGDSGDELPEGVLFLPAAGVDPAALLARLDLLLLGHQVGLAADWGLGSLVGDLAATPLLELLQALGRARVTGCLELPRGTLFLSAGEVVAAQAGKVRGIKAVCRLARLQEGPLRLLLEPSVVAREIHGDLSSVMVAVIEDTLSEPPPPGTRLRVEMGPGLFSAPFEDVEQQILTAVGNGIEVGELLDTLPLADGEIIHRVESLEQRGVLVREAPRPSVRVVTDSTSDLPRLLAHEHGITVVPLAVRFGRESFRDRVDLSPPEFYHLLASRPEHPASSPPSREDFSQVFSEHVPHSDVVAIHISARLSETTNHARAAAAVVRNGAAELRGTGPPAALEVVDSHQVSLALGLLALFAARMARRGQSATEIAVHLRRMRDRIHALFVVDTLEYLARGGRIGKARALMGNLLRIKPILTIEGGEVAPLDRVRGGRAAHPRILELLRGRLDPERSAVCAIVHAQAPVWADRLRQLVEDELPVSELILGEMGPVVGTHAGPGTVGVASFQPTPEEAPLIAPLDAT